MGDPKKPSSNDDGIPTLRDLKITHDQSSEWQIRRPSPGRDRGSMTPAAMPVSRSLWRL